MTETSGEKTFIDPAKLQGQLRLSRILNVALLLLVAILVVVVVVRPAAAPAPEAGTNTEQSQPSTPTATPTVPEQNVQPEAKAPASHVRAQADDPLAVGSIDAPVVISEWTDYRCPYCALFANETLPTLLKDYVDSGQVRIEFNDVFFFGDESFDAAVAARAAAAQGYYLPYIEALYAAAPENGGHPPMPREKLIGFAQEAGVPDLKQFEADLDSEEIKAAVQASHNQAVALGVNSVPFFVVGDQALAGAQPLEVFQQVIAQQLG